MEQSVVEELNMEERVIAARKAKIRKFFEGYYRLDNPVNVNAAVKELIGKGYDGKLIGEVLHEKQIGLGRKIEEGVVVEKKGTTKPTPTPPVLSKAHGAKELNKIKPYFFDKTKSFWLWDTEKYRWDRVDDVDILNMINEATGQDILDPKSRTRILNSLKQEGRKNIPKDIKKTWVQFKDKIYDIDTGKNFTATPEYFVTNPIDWEISYNPETPKMDALFEEWVGLEHVKKLYQIISYCLLPDYPLHRIFCFIGAGMNGKSCLLRLISNFMGKENVTNSDLDRLLISRFEVTKLYKKSVCLMGETNFNEMSQTSMLKKLSDGSDVGFEYKGKTPFDGVSYAKIIIATNNLPATNDKTIGFYRRWMIIDFPRQFDEKKDILNTIPEEEYNNLATKSLVILKELLENRCFDNEGNIEDRMKTYEDHSNPFDKFFEENVAEDSTQNITKNQFTKQFQAWCAENKFRKIGERTINSKMKEKGIYEAKALVFWEDDGKRVEKQARVWDGIKWKK